MALFSKKEKRKQAHMEPSIDDLEFRKHLTEYGITIEEYEELPEDKKEALHKTYKSKRMQQTGQAIQGIGEGIQGCGCLIMLIPIAAILIYIIYIILSS